ncbi:MAG: 4Fe-4S binding protein [Candidatus Bathyarchaeota archaeon]|nr:MAG: 4Fe-4S binding protein [Candidatus Bathyarchaeota archaeon]
MMWENSNTLVLSVFTLIVPVGIFFILRWTKDKTRNVSTLRFFIQIVALVAVFMGLVLGPFDDPITQPLGPAPRDRLIGAEFLGNQFPDGLSVPIFACYYASGRTVTCPIWQIQAYIFPFWSHAIGYFVFYSTSGLEKLAIVFGLVITMSIVLGKFFCGWLCPFGLYQDLITRIRKVFRIRHLSLSENTNAILGQFGYIIIAVFLILSFIFGSYSISGIQLIPGTQPGGPLGTEAGIVGYINEPFCLVCPMRPLSVLVLSALGYMRFSYVSQITYGPFWTIGYYVTSINLAVLIAITVLSLAYRRFWCRICPLGALTALFSTSTLFEQIALTRLHKTEQKCTKCGICKRVCPTQAIQMYEKKGGDVTESRCILCARCVEMCPYENALTLKVAGKTVMKSRNWLQKTDKTKLAHAARTTDACN